MKKVVLFSIIALALAACGKDKFKTVPTVVIDSFDPAEVTKGQTIQLKATVTDEEGDLQDSVIVYRKIYNPVNNALLTTDSLLRANLGTLGVPTKRKIELLITLVYGESRPEIGPTQNNGSTLDRQLVIGLYVRDKAGNRSEYVESKPILLKKI